MVQRHRNLTRSGGLSFENNEEILGSKHHVCLFTFHFLQISFYKSINLENLVKGSRSLIRNNDFCCLKLTRGSKFEMQSACLFFSILQIFVWLLIYF